MSKKKAAQNNSRRKILIVFVALFAAVILLSLGISVLQNDRILQFFRSGQSYDETFFISGKITEKVTSCGREILDTDGKRKAVTGVCDSGAHIAVDGLVIITGGGYAGDPSKFITDIDSLHAGDTVEVRYTLDKDSKGKPSTDCESCYVKNRALPEKQPQNKLHN